MTASLDLDIQERVTRLARKHLAGWRAAGAEQVAVMVVERGTRRVLASLGSADYRDRRAGAIDYTKAQRSPGSTLKPFIYALALERGLIRTSDTMADLPDGAGERERIEARMQTEAPVLERERRRDHARRQVLERPVAVIDSRPAPFRLLLVPELGEECAVAVIEDGGRGRGFEPRAV